MAFELDCVPVGMLVALAVVRGLHVVDTLGFEERMLDVARRDWLAEYVLLPEPRDYSHGERNLQTANYSFAVHCHRLKGRACFAEARAYYVVTRDCVGYA